jgi:crotonobetainyl-CoA:carnitine CoA-transferase CaiB-like acyl-CoA transferase
MAITGEPGRPPVRVGIPLADLSGGIFACKGILAALFDRERSGEGRRIELSMFDSMLNLLGYIGTMWLTNGELPRPPGSAHDYTVPWQAFAAKDGYFVVGTRQEVFWRRLCEVIGQRDLANDARFSSNARRIENREELIPILVDIFSLNTVGYWLEQLRAAEVPAAPVNNLDAAFSEPPVIERNMIVEYDHPDVGPVRLPGNPIKMSGAEGTISRPAPRLGEHTDEILSQVLKLQPERIAELRTAGVIK